jgi:LPXTG-motif cell wall-anchored protein
MTQRSLRHPLALALLAALTTVSLALAKGPPDKLTISGPGLQGEIEVTDPALLADIGFGGLEEFDSNGRHGIPEPAVGEGYTLIRLLRNPNGTFQPWDQLRYYPNALDGRGVVFYDGLIGPNTSEFDGRWYFARPAGEAGMQRLLATLGVTAPVPQALPATGATTARPWLIGLGAALLLAGGLLHRRRASTLGR